MSEQREQLDPRARLAEQAALVQQAQRARRVRQVARVQQEILDRQALRGLQGPLALLDLRAQPLVLQDRPDRPALRSVE